jgi:hypothetical protein
VAAPYRIRYGCGQFRAVYARFPNKGGVLKKILDHLRGSTTILLIEWAVVTFVIVVLVLILNAGLEGMPQ